MKIETLLFDFDGTLVDSEALHFQSWNKVLTSYGVSYDEYEFCNDFSGVPTEKTAGILKQRHAINETAEALISAKNQFFSAPGQLPVLLPFAKDIIALAAQRYRLALVTGSSRSEAYPVLKHYGMFEHFEYIVCKDDVSSPKPAPTPYLQALSLLNVEAEYACAIEDSETGLSSAFAAGVTPIVIPNAHSKRQNLSKAQLSFDSLTSLWDWLNNQA